MQLKQSEQPCLLYPPLLPERQASKHGKLIIGDLIIDKVITIMINLRSRLVLG